MSFVCPCCGYKTFRHKPDGSYDICGVCYWEDDPVQLKDPDCEVGANKVSLRQAQKNFQLFGASEEDMVKLVRKPAADEARDETWKPLHTVTNTNFFITSMPASRPADYYLGYMDGSVFLDFIDSGNRIALIRISFDGHGCCELGEHSIPLNENDSKIFKNTIRENIKGQSALLDVVKRAIALNKKIIWIDALEEYHLA